MPVAFVSRGSVKYVAFQGQDSLISVKKWW